MRFSIGVPVSTKAVSTLQPFDRLRCFRAPVLDALRFVEHDQIELEAKLGGQLAIALQ